ncbi:MAG: hypothetical protein L6Q53_14550 [Candidatus Brocadia sinica]|nr:hypothetical protein [Candidatus Brocadia sinica]
MITKRDLLKRLENEKFKISNRMLTHFISLGLIKKPMRFGLGKGKGSVSEFDDRTFKDIKEIMKLHKEGLTYEEIKHKRMSSGEWLSLVNQLRESSKSEEDVTNFIKKIPYLSDREKGRLKITSDITDRLTKVVVDELESILGPINDEATKASVIYDVNHAIEFCLDNVFCDFGLTDEDYEEYLNKGKVWRIGKIFLRSKRSYRMGKNQKKTQTNESIRK